MTLAEKARRVLLVEDDEPFRVMLAWCLADLGYAVTQAEGVAEALALTERGWFDAALVDYRLPDGLGQEILLAVRERDPRVTVVMMSAELNAELRDEALAAGARDFLTKPVCSHRLDSMLSGVAAPPGGEAQ